MAASAEVRVRVLSIPVLSERESLSPVHYHTTYHTTQLECILTLRSQDHYSHCHFHPQNFSVWISSSCGGVFCVVQSCGSCGSGGGGRAFHPVASAARSSASVLSAVARVPTNTTQLTLFQAINTIQYTSI